MIKKIKLVLKILLLLVAIGFLVFAFVPERTKVDLHTVERGNILVTLEGEGKTRIHDIYTVSAPIDGRITRIEREAGDRVVADETVIANMYPANPQFLDKRSEIQARADVEGAKAALALSNARIKQARAQLEFDQAELNRISELFKKQSVSKSDLERAELRIKTLQAELETALSNREVMASKLEAAKARLIQPELEKLQPEAETGNCHICLFSPVDGQVLRILHKDESIVPVGTALVEIGDPKDLEVNVEVLSFNAVKIQPGDEALIKRWGGQENINARVRVVEPSGFTKISALGVEEQRVNVVLELTDPSEKWSRLGDAFRVEAAIIIDRATDVLTVPLSALFRHNELWSVFKVVDDTVALQQVRIGKRNDKYAEITEGLSLGDKIITHPSNAIEEGLRVMER